jgi:hypothetical protein
LLLGAGEDSDRCVERFEKYEGVHFCCL